MKILITGSNGLLGSKLVKLFNEKNVDYLATSLGSNRNPLCSNNFYTSMDITDRDDVNRVMNEYQPDAVIHTAAMTQVDACEEEKEKCDRINVEGTEKVFDASKQVGAHFNLLSTDFVFDGKDGPYKENDEVNPLSYYATSKRKAEETLLNDKYENWAITRTIIVFGYEPHLSRSNLVLWAREALQKGDSLNIVDDQFRAPTDADDLAQACFDIAQQKACGIYHIGGPETKSIFEWVKFIAKYYEKDVSLIKPVSSQTLNQAAKRPPKTGFILDKAKKTINYSPLTFEESLDKIEKETTFSK